MYKYQSHAHKLTCKDVPKQNPYSFVRKTDKPRQEPDAINTHAVFRLIERILQNEIRTSAQFSSTCWGKIFVCETYEANEIIILHLRESPLTSKWLTVWPKQNPLEKFYLPHIGLAAALLNKSRYKNLNAVAYPDRYSEKWKSHTHRHGR